MNDLEKFFQSNNEKNINKWLHYFDIYEENFSKYRNKKITVLEIGVFRGGSLKMWKNYFKDESLIVGIDINPNCKKFENKDTKIFIGDQTDQNFLNKVIKTIGKPDIIIDDGGHTSNQQITTFNNLYNKLNDQGTYLVEDTHSSYHPKFQDREDNFTFIEYAKSLSDKLNFWYQCNDYKIYKNEIKEEIDTPYFTKNTYKISFYNSIVVFEKKQIQTPRSILK